MSVLASAAVLAAESAAESSGSDPVLFLGDNLIVWILLALGGAMFAGNVMALVRPPEAPRQEGDLERAPRGRSIAMAAIGFVVAVAAFAALIT